ncbi:hypothetical protein HMPREF1621_02133 [Escherichia coli A25922R]|nr:hypothetical protein HMPREF9549_01345 [Escherichia coli MS 185-1]EFJ91564.1 hypothetical protein HMPREF9531_03367 [Escherichia coli MS 45-1]EFU52534.1 hypothetical protein HMPREF9544_02374 [Escherichia coli MS 153-1]ESD37824.1 hypothetical protein HMPREF1603_02567 [Escherichia coli 907892]ESE19651.1 hypothetical protein HMPREF1617_01479 [Escherichia coli 908675]ESE28340.1 hypothetical protein HMPREF1622_04548 [Escherichia coli A35218R]ESE34758.1 hypothetical protein HMPREF1621_02133 [Esche
MKINRSVNHYVHCTPSFFSHLSTPENYVIISTFCQNEIY